jgi:hypothetical protein
LEIDRNGKGWSRLASRRAITQPVRRGTKDCSQLRRLVSCRQIHALAVTVLDGAAGILQQGAMSKELRRQQAATRKHKIVKSTKVIITLLSAAAIAAWVAALVR